MTSTCCAMIASGAAVAAREGAALAGAAADADGAAGAGVEDAGGAAHGVGARREATVGGHRYEETILVRDEGRRWGYRIDRATVPIATAQVECTEFEDRGTGTRLRWIVAHDPRMLMWCASPFFP